MSSAIDVAAAAVLPPPTSMRSAYASAAPLTPRTTAFTPAAPAAPAPAAPPPPARTAEPTRTTALAGEQAATDIRSLVDSANSSLEMQSRSLRFRVNPEIDDVQIQILDASRDKVIRSIPSEDMVAIAARMRELSGLGSQIDVSR